MFDQALRIQKGVDYTEFSYGIGNERIKRVDSNTIDQSRTTLYFGSVERIVQDGGNAFFRRSIGGIALADYFPATQVQITNYLLKDHLGSIDKVVTTSGVTAMSFGAFGERRASTWQGALSATLTRSINIAISTRGFTGHEQADGLGIIHMNGRIYDPKLGRMLQADPFVQDPKNSQSLNRYSYVLNNPLSYTDPSGYFSLSKAWKKIRPFVAIAVVAVGSAFGPLGAFAAGAQAGYISTGSITGALIGAFSAAAFSAIGMQFQGILTQAKSAAYASVFAQTGSVFQAANASLFTGLSVGQQVAKTLAHGIMGGVMSFLGGGKFGHGFAAAGFTQAFSGTIGNFSTPQGRIAAAGVVGGTASALTGGKFANGAVTGAFSRAFNDELEQSVDKRVGKLERLLTDEEKAIYADHFPAELLGSVRVYEGKVPWWLRSEMDGITLGSKIYFRQGVYEPGTAGGVEFLGHELFHVQQYADGMTYREYIWASRNGYWNNPFEISAYAKSAQIRSGFCSVNPQTEGC